MAFSPIIGSLVLAFTVSTDLLGLMGGDHAFFSAINRNLAGRSRVLCTTPEAVAACKEKARFDEMPTLDSVLDYYREHGAGLLSSRDRQLLLDHDTNRIQRAVMRRDYTGMGLFPKAEDPYYFLNNYLVDLKSRLPDSAKGTVLYASDLTEQELSALIDLAGTRDDVFLSGAPFHTLLAKRASLREINLLSIVSVLAVVAIGFWLFGNLRFVLPVLMTLLAGFAAGTIVLFLVYPAPHVLTFVFGTSLIGLGVDYCYHGKSRNLLKALVSSVLAFAPLMFSHLAVLNQMAVFSITGLVTIYLCVRSR